MAASVKNKYASMNKKANKNKSVTQMKRLSVEIVCYWFSCQICMSFTFGQWILYMKQEICIFEMNLEGDWIGSSTNKKKSRPEKCIHEIQTHDWMRIIPSNTVFVLGMASSCVAYRAIPHRYPFWLLWKKYFHFCLLLCGCLRPCKSTHQLIEQIPKNIAQSHFGETSTNGIESIN